MTSVSGAILAWDLLCALKFIIKTGSQAAGEELREGRVGFVHCADPQGGSGGEALLSESKWSFLATESLWSTESKTQGQGRDYRAFSPKP